MLLKIHLIISVVAFVLTVICNIGLAYQVRDKYGKEAYLKTCKTNTFSSIFSWLKSLLICFLPIYNIVYLLVMLFCTKEIERRLFEEAEDNMRRS